MLFDENFAKLSEKLSHNNITLENNGDTLVLRENVQYALSNLPRLKDELKEVYKLRFNWDKKYWFLGNEGIRKLSERMLKFKPTCLKQS